MTKRGAEATSHHDNIRSVARMQINSVHYKVLTVLEEVPSTRSSDKLLIEEVYDRYYGVVNLPFWQVMESELPSFETITRCRRKIQQEREDLRGTKETENNRLDLQKDFIKYSQEEMA